MAIDIKNMPAGEVPPEIQQAFQELLKVQGRVKFPLKPTKVSAVSTSSEDVDDTGEKEVDDLIKSVDELEDLVEQLEDMADQLTKDMAIPVDPGPLEKAVKRLGGNNVITQQVFNTALAILDNAGPITLRNDPVVAALTGDGHIEGPWLKCSSVTDQVADVFNLRKGKPGLPEEPVVPRNQEIIQDFEGNLLEMILHIILMLWWNMIWPKFLVDLVVIDPLRMMIGYPFDGIAGFFKKETRFRKKSKDWLKKYGTINKALNRFRKFLLCRVPHVLWSSADEYYDPIVEIDCPTDETWGCPPDPTQYDENGSAANSSFIEDGDVSEIGKAMDEADSNVCGAPEDYGALAPPDEPENLGMPPECYDAAARVVRAVEDASYTPNSPTANDSTLETDLSTTIENNFII